MKLLSWNAASFFSLRNRLILSLLLGGGSAVLVVFFLHQEKKGLERQFVMAQAVVAKKYIAQGKIITPDLVEILPIPVRYLQPTVLKTPEELKQDGKKYSFKARIGFLKGEQITKSKIFEETSLLGLAWVLLPNQTAFSLRLNVEDAVAGLLQPGDLVCVYARGDKRKEAGGANATVVLPQVQVLAVQNEIWDPSSIGAKTIKQENMPSESILVTLGLTKLEAAHLAGISGQTSLALGLLSPLSRTANEQPLAQSINTLR